MLHWLHCFKISKITSLRSSHRRKIPSKEIQKSPLSHRITIGRLNAIPRQKYRKESESHQNYQAHLRNNSSPHRKKSSLSVRKCHPPSWPKGRLDQNRSRRCCQKTSSWCLSPQKSQSGYLSDHPRSKRTLIQISKQHCLMFGRWDHQRRERKHPIFIRFEEERINRKSCQN